MSESTNINSNEERSQTKELTEQQKWECVARWLNRLYRGYANGTKPEIACSTCPHITECPSTCMGKPLAGATPVPNHFKVIERFTGKGTVISALVDYKGAPVL